MLASTRLFELLLLLAASPFLGWFAKKFISGEIETRSAKAIERLRAELRNEHDLALEQFCADLRQENDEALEGLRARLQLDQALNVATMTAFSSAHLAAADRRLKAVEDIWTAAVGSRTAARKLMGLLDLIPREEMRIALTEPRREATIGKPTDESIRQELWTVSEGIECVRPFVEEPLWALFFGYRALLGRIVVRLKIGREKRALQFWLDDPHARGLLEALVDPPDLQHIEETPVGSILEMTKAVELRLAKEARRTISGEVASEEAMRRARLILMRSQESQPSEP